MRILEAPGGEHRLLKVPFCEYAMRGTSRPRPALLVFSSTKWTYAIMVDISTVRISYSPGGKCRLFQVPFCEYAMRGSPGPHPTLLMFTDIKCSHAVMVDTSTVRISEGPGVSNAYSRSHFANTQCESTLGRIPL